LNTISLDDNKDQAVWKWSKLRKFFVKSTYYFLAKDDVGVSYGRIWKTRIPEKIKIFM
jgi:hypothetical protein